MLTVHCSFPFSKGKDLLISLLELPICSNIDPYDDLSFCKFFSTFHILTVIFNQGNIPTTYIMSVLDIYEAVLQESSNNSDHVEGKVKQEILHGLGTISIPQF